MIRKVILLLCVLIPAVFAATAFATPETATRTDTVPLKQQIIGVWTIQPNNRTTTGTMVFKETSTYEMNETLKDNSSAGTKGEFTLDETVTPARLRLCLGKCNQPGAEWVTRFCILQLTSATTMEIYISTTGSFPDGFPEDKNAENYLILKKNE